jgi:hypothetical protein
MIFAPSSHTPDHGVHSDRERLPFPAGGVWSARGHLAASTTGEQATTGRSERASDTLHLIEAAEQHLRDLSQHIDLAAVEQIDTLRFRAAETPTDDADRDPDPPRAA